MRLTAIRTGLLAAAVFAATVLNATTLRVVSKAADKTGDWSSAYLSIADAISAAAANDTILVASGKYELGSTLVVNKAGLTIRSVSLTTGEEDPENTILDGGDDPANSVDGVRIMQVSAQRVSVSGFTFAHAYYDGSGGAALRLESNVAHYLSVSNCTFTGNRSTGEGTGIYSWVNNYVVIEDCVFTNNTLAASGMAEGCAVYTQQNNVSTERIELRRCVFGGNHISGAYIRGGVLWADRAITLDGCTFRGDDTFSWVNAKSSNYGLVLRVGQYSKVLNCTMTGSSPSGSPIGSYGTYFLIGEIGVVVSNCTFNAISEGQASFGLININGRSATFVDSKFTGNSPKSHMIYILGTSGHLFRNCLFAGNANDSGSIINDNGSNGYTIENCTFAGNNASKNTLSYDGAAPSTNYIVNTIFTAPIKTPSSAKTFVVSNSCLTALLGGEFDHGNITGDPGFKLARLGNYRLLSTSPCVNAGMRLDWMDGDSHDLSGYPRIVGSAVDMGCYEWQERELDTSLLVVARDEDKTDGWEEASTDVQGVINAAADGDLILVRSGTYSLESELVLSNKTVTFMSRNPTTGGTDRDGTIFDGTMCAGRAMVVSTGPMANTSVSHGFTPINDHPIVVDGFTFRNFNLVDGDGGAIWFGGQGAIGGTAAVITNCTFKSNYASGKGGAILMFHGGSVRDCQFICNTSGGRGGAIHSYSMASYSYNVQGWDGIDMAVRGWYYPSAISCLFEGNVGGGYGGAVSATQNIYIDGCTFRTNTTSGAQGAALNCDNSSRTLNCLFEGNTFKSSSGYGSAMLTKGTSCVSNCVVRGSGNAYGSIYMSDLGIVVDCVATNNASEGIWMNGGTIRQCLLAGNSIGVRQFQTSSRRLDIENCTIADNRVGVDNSNAANSNFIVNSIISGNTTASVRLSKNDGTQTCTVSNSVVDVDKPASAYITFVDVRKAANMRFVDAVAGDYHLTARSPACDKGAILPWMTSASVDFDGNPRIVSRAGLPLSVDASAKPDFGCYEFQAAHLPPGLSIVIE